jgi:alkylation response protein AidB-like acyl-CoA dehydrogenase
MQQVDRAKQVAEAEELLGKQAKHLGFVNQLYFGKYQDAALPPYPNLWASAEVNNRVQQLHDFCQTKIDPVAIDRDSRIPDEVVAGLGKLGVLGACMPKKYGGLDYGQVAYCRLMEVIGARCASTAIFVNAHHSIGPRALALFGNEEQQAKYMPKLCSGEWISAFGLTEPEAGSDAANVQTRATPTPDGKGFLLNGQKRWITNGGISQVLTVMARTPVAASSDTKVSAFIVTPDMPGFEVVEARMDKCGIRGTATAKLAFHDMYVPRENVLGQLGKGLRIALTVLDYGRTTFGASCTGAAKYCLAKARSHVTSRVQFGEPLANFELVKQKLAYMAAGTFAMEAATYQTAALIDADVGEFMIETAMLKVFSTEVLWQIVFDTFQLYGGKAYFTDEPFERIMRDARINQIGEGANDVLQCFIALMGMREVGLELQSVLQAAKSPLANFEKLSRFAGHKLESWFASPTVSVQHAELQAEASRLGTLAASLGGHVEKLLRTYRESILERQYQLDRVAKAATEIYVSACVLRRLDWLLDAREHSANSNATGSNGQPQALAEITADIEVGKYYLKTAARRINQNLAALWFNDDADTTAIANRVIAG